MALFASFRAALLLGKANRQLQDADYEAALARALRARKLPLKPQYAWLCAMIEGKSRYHLGDRDGALEPLRRARDGLQPMLAAQPDSRPLHNIRDDIESLIANLEPEQST